MAAESEKDILGRADALLKRQAQRPAGSDSGAFPVLTDFIEDKSAMDELAREIHKRVMHQVEGRLAHDLEARVAQHLAPHIHTAVVNAIGDLRQELSKAVAEAVHDAVAARNKQK